MMSHFISAFMAFVSAHPHWVGFAVFAATAMESMAIVGSLFPGMTMVIAISGLAASLGASIGLLVLWCTLGAVLGDGVSFWIGHRYGDHLKSMWPFRTRPELLGSGVAFFEKNGGKSIVIGRFLPFTRAVVPVAAGMLGMNPVRFYVANILSAIGWAVVNVLPAAGIGLSFALINESSSRVALMLGLFVVLYGVSYVIVHLLAHRLLPALGSLYAFVRSADDKRLSMISTAGVLLSLVLVLAFTAVLEDVASGDPLVRADLAISNLLQGFRTPLGDHIMVSITALGDTTVVLWTCVILLGSLLARQAWRTFSLALLALVGTSIFVPLLKWILHKPRPIDLYSGAEAFSFPSGHSAYAAVILGLIAVLGARGRSRHVQTTVWTTAIFITTLVGVSRIYLSAHWPSDVMGGLLFGWLMAAMFGVFEAKREDHSPHSILLFVAVVIGMFTGWGAHAAISIETNLALYAPRVQVLNQSLDNWLGGGWQDLSAARIDLKGEYEEPLIMQAAALPSTLESALSTAGWTQTRLMDWRDATQFIGGAKELSQLSPLPLLHNGRSASLTMIGPKASRDTRTVVRFWRTGRSVEVNGERREILAGSIVKERLTYPFYGLNALRDGPTSPQNTERVISALRKSPSLRLLDVPPSKTRQAPLWLLAPQGLQSWK